MKVPTVCSFGLAALTALSTFAHLPDCPETFSAQGKFSSGAEFQFNTTADSLLASGAISYSDAVDQMFLSSSDLMSYGFLDQDGRYVEFATAIDGEIAVIRLLVWDNGTVGDTLVLQLHVAGVIVLEENESFATDFVQFTKEDCQDGQVPPDGEEVPPDGEEVPPDGEEVPPDGEEVPPDDEEVPPHDSAHRCPLTIGYWMNHDAHLEEVLAAGAIDLGDTLVVTLEDALAVLQGANAKDIRDMLRAQLLGTYLNLANGADAWLIGEDIRIIAEHAIDFLAAHTGPVLGGHRDRDHAVTLKDRFDLFNNSDDDCEGDQGEGDQGEGDQGEGDQGEGDQGEDDQGEDDDRVGSALTIGYWKNHVSHLAVILTAGAIDLGDTTVTSAQEAAGVFAFASAKDMRNMLRAQLLATLLNLANGADPLAEGQDVTGVVNEAIEFLRTHPEAVTEDHPDRNFAESLKDDLDAFNNSRSTIEIFRVGRKGQALAKVALVWSGSATLQTAESLAGPWSDLDQGGNGLLGSAEGDAKFYRVRLKGSK